MKVYETNNLKTENFISSAHDRKAKQRKVGNLKYYTDRLQPVSLLLTPNLLVLIRYYNVITSG